MKKPIVAAVVAIGRNRGLGRDGKLLWRIPDDVQRFRDLTRGHALILGRKTFDSILSYRNGQPLPDRTNIVITRDPNWSHEGVIVTRSLEEALEKAREVEQNGEIHIGGGAQIYAEALPFIDKLYLTLVDDEKEADSFFPPYDEEFTKKVAESDHEWQGIKYKYLDLVRG